MPQPKYRTKLHQIPELDEEERARLQPVVDEYVFRTNDYYNSLIDWNDPNDPIRTIIMPAEGELEVYGKLDASDEHKYMVAPGLEHKYTDTALILVNDVCGAYCRFCFRKRLFMDGNDDTIRDLGAALEYIREHKEINNVLLTGGDPLIVSTKKLSKLIADLRAIDHIKIIRIGTKMTTFNPYRFLEDPAFFEMLEQYSTDTKKIYIMNHFNHPRELTDEAVEVLNRIMKAGAAVVNQTPMIRNVNDSVEVLKALFEKLSFMGVPPYYVFQCRPTAGNKIYSVPLEEAAMIMDRTRRQVSGLAARARFAMSHASGKIEILGLTDETIMFRYHRAADPENRGKIMIFKRNPEAHWLDDYTELLHEYHLN